MPLARPKPGERAGARYQVTAGMVVELEYDLFDADDLLVETSDLEGPLQAVIGYGQLAAAVEHALEGARRGDERRVALEAVDAFGERDPSRVVEVDREELPAALSPGTELEAEDEAGELVVMRVVSVTGQSVLLDTNHPLAGQRVSLDLRVAALRPATGAELLQAERLLVGASPARNETLIPAPVLLKRRGRPVAAAGGAHDEHRRPGSEPTDPTE